MSAMDLLVQLRDAGIKLTAASALVDEDQVVQALGLGPASGAPAAFDFGSGAPAAVASPPAPPADAPANGAAAPANGARTPTNGPAPAPAAAPPVARPDRVAGTPGARR